MADIPIVYTLTVCPACDLLRNSWRREGVQYEERRVDQSQDTLDEALDFGDTVPIIVLARWPGGNRIPRLARLRDWLTDGQSVSEPPEFTPLAKQPEKDRRQPSDAQLARCNYGTRNQRGDS